MARTPLPVRIAIWRRRVVAGSLALFAAAWIAVAGFGRQATSTAATGQSTRAATSGTQTSAQTIDPYSGYDNSDSSQSSAAQSDSTQTDSTQTDSTQTDSSQSDMSGATTRQS